MASGQVLKKMICFAEKAHPSRWHIALAAGSLFALFIALLPFATKRQEGLLQPVGEVTIINGNASGLARYGDFLYMVMNESTRPLLVYEISEPNQPKLLRYMTAPGWPMRCRTVGDWLWTVHGNGEGFFHLSDPASPRFSENPAEGPNLRRLERVMTRNHWRSEYRYRKFLVHPCLTYSSCATENTLFYGTLDEKTEIYDIGNPQQPRLLATLDSGVPKGLQGHLLFLSGSKRLQVFDVRDPSAPKLLGRLESDKIEPLAKEGFSLRGSAVAIGDGKLFVGIQRDLPDFLGLERGPYEGGANRHCRF